MNITEIKAAVASKTNSPCLKLAFTQQLDKDGQPTPWVSHWDADSHVRVTMHMEVFEAIKADPIGFDGLQLKPMEKVAAHTAKDAEGNEVMIDGKAKIVEAYTRFIVITPQSVLGEF